MLDPSASEGIRTGAIWVWTNARWVSFFFSAHGDGQSVRDFLGDDLARNVQCDGTKRTAAILSIIATCIAHDVNPRAYLHVVTKLIVHGFPQKKLRDLLPDRMLGTHPEFFAGESFALLGSAPPALAPFG